MVVFAPRRFGILYFTLQLAYCPNVYQYTLVVEIDYSITLCWRENSEDATSCYSLDVLL